MPGKRDPEMQADTFTPGPGNSPLSGSAAVISRRWRSGKTKPSGVLGAAGGGGGGAGGKGHQWPETESPVELTQEAGLHVGDRWREKREGQTSDVSVACCPPSWASRPRKRYSRPTSTPPAWCRPSGRGQPSRTARGEQGQLGTGWRWGGPEAGLLGEECLSRQACAPTTPVQQ